MENKICKLLRIFLGESDKLNHELLYEKIVAAAKANDMAGCTVLRGIISYGSSSIVHASKLIELAADLPVVVEIIDEENKITSFTKIAGELLDESGCGGLITIEAATIIWYKPKK